MSKRLAMLEKLTASESADSFAFYALAMEYSGLERHDDALATYTKLRGKDPTYVPMYLMCGTMLQKLQRTDDAREWLSAGIDAAKAKGDGHALSEIESALASL